MDHKWLIHPNCQHSFGCEDDKRLIPAGCGIRSGARITSGWCTGLLALVRAIRGKDHKWLMQNGYQHSFSRKDDERLVPIGCQHSLWSEDDDRLVPPAVGTRSSG